MKKFLSILLFSVAVPSYAQFVPGQLLTAAELNTQFSLYAKLSGATFTGPVTFPSGTISLPALAAQASNTVLANATAGSASPTAVAIPSCNAATSALQWTPGTGFVCNSSVANGGANTNISSIALTAHSNLTVAPSGAIPASPYPYSSLGMAVVSTSDNASGGTTDVSSPTLLYSQQYFGGSAINTGRNNIAAFTQFTAPTSASNPYRFYVGVSSYMSVLAGDNGTVGTPAGVFEAGTDQIQLASGVTNVYAEIGHEIAISALTGSSVANKAALLLDQFANDTVHGSNVDAWIWTYGFTGSTGQNTWAELDAAGGAPALPSTGTVINLSSIPTIATGFNFGSTSVTGNVLQWGSGANYLAGNGSANFSGNDALFYINNSGQTIANNTLVPITTWTKVSDRVNANFNASTGVFTAPATGNYRVSAQLTYAAAALALNQPYEVQILVNSASYSTGIVWGESTSISAITAAVSTVVSVTAGQTIKIAAYQASGLSLTLSTSSGLNSLSIDRIP